MNSVVYNSIHTVGSGVGGQGLNVQGLRGTKLSLVIRHTLGYERFSSACFFNSDTEDEQVCECVNVCVYHTHIGVYTVYTPIFFSLSLLYVRVRVCSLSLCACVCVYICVCVCMCVYMCGRVCVCVCVYVISLSLSPSLPPYLSLFHI